MVLGVSRRAHRSFVAAAHIRHLSNKEAIPQTKLLLPSILRHLTRTTFSRCWWEISKIYPQFCMFRKSSEIAFFTCGSQDAGLGTLGSLLLLRKLKKKANAPILTPESWHRGVTGHEKANGEVRFSLRGQMEAKTASKN